MSHNDVLGDRYRLDRLLADGWYKTVWKAYDTVLDRDVAVALYRVRADDAHAVSAVARDELWRVLRAVAGLSEHPRIVTVFDAGQFRERPFLVNRLLTGGDLVSLLDAQPQRRLSPARAAAIAGDVLDALAVIHAAGIVHRNVQPRSIWIDVDGRALLGGLGYVPEAFADAFPELSTSRRRIAYAAPELINGEPGGAGVDVYALGCTLYEMLTGRPPFTGEPGVIAGQQLTAPPAPLSLLVPALPPALDGAVQLLLKKDPGARPDSAERAKVLVHEGVGEQRAAAAAPAAPPQTVKSGREEPAQAAITGVTPLLRQPPDQSRPPEPVQKVAPPLPLRPRPSRHRWLLAALVGGAALVVLALLVPRRSLSPPAEPEQSPSQSAESPTHSPAEHASPVIALTPGPPAPVAYGLRIYDNIFDLREHAFIVDRTVTACFQVGADGETPLVIVVTRGGQQAGSAADLGVAGRSDDIPQRAGGVCAPVPLTDSEPQPGEYVAWLLRNADVLDLAAFQVTGVTVAGAPPPPPSGLRPAEVVARYYSLLFQKQWPGAYQLLSGAYQQQRSYERWREENAAWNDLLVDAVQDGPAANTVTVRYRTVDELPTGQEMRAWVEEWQLVVQDGEWRLDSARKQQTPVAFPTPAP